AEGATEGISHCPSVETRHGTAKPRYDFKQTACPLAEEHPQSHRTRQFEKRLQAQWLSIDGSDRMQHFQLQRTDNRQIGYGQWSCPHSPSSTGIRHNVRLRMLEMQTFQLPRQ